MLFKGILTNLTEAMRQLKHETLGRNVLPVNYRILLDTNLRTFKYNGSETISVKITSPTDTIMLNAKYIKISSARIVFGKYSFAAKVSYNDKLERASLKIAKKISGNAKIELEFQGENRYDMRGFYRSKYIHEGKEGWILTSQFESVSARTAFPCFDEPSMKATFDLSLIIDGGHIGISNMPIRSERAVGKGRRMLTFKTTPIMSSYLLYMGVGPFEQISWKSDGISFRVITVPGKSSQLELAKEFSTKFMRYYQDYFRVKYPLPKMDFIAVPDFQVGAMENWGAITAREIGIIGDRATTSVPIMRYIGIILSHELAHQWFGDLVTMDWWNDLWLNESFATFMEEKTLEATYPKWKMETYHIINDTALAMSDDQLRTTHPIHVDINNPKEIEEIFDTISYQKGGAVLRMMEDYVSPEVFRKGLKIYFTKHAYSNTVERDLWNAIAATGNANARMLPDVASRWIDNPGYPILKVEGPKDGVFKITQERFTILPCKGARTNWPVPVRYMTDRGEGFVMINGSAQTIRVPGAKFIKLNYRQKGFYRVAYSKDNLKMLGREIKSKRLGALDAWGVINDLSALARSCRIKVSDVLDFIEEYCMECDYPVNAAITGYFTGVALRFYKSGPLYKRAKKLEKEFNAKLLKKLGWKKQKDELPYITSLRSGAISTLGMNGSKQVVGKARTMFKQYIGSGKKPDADLKVAVYRTVAYNGGAREFERFVSLYRKRNTSEEQRALQVALGSLSTKSLNERALEFSLSKHVRPQDQSIISSYVASNPEGRDLMLNWTEKNWKTVRRMFKVNTSILVDYIENLAILQTKEDLNEVKRFFSSKQNYVSDINRALKNTLEYIESNERFVSYNS